MGRFRIKLLGRFDLIADGQSVRVPAKARELIAFLAIQPSRRARRQRVSGTLWPETSDERAMGNLNTSLWRLRKAVLRVSSPDFIEASREEIALNANRVEVDSWEFEECAGLLTNHFDAAQATRAVELYGGELLDGEFDAEWLMNERERLGLLHMKVLRIQARFQARSGMLSQALATYERLLIEDPTDEQVCREMMRLHFAMGNRGEALRVYTFVSKRVESDLAAVPEAETTTLRDLIKQGLSPDADVFGIDIPAPSIPSSDNLEMVGRDGELEELTRALLQVTDGKLVVVGIEGEPGIGKTRLVMEFARELTAKGCRVLSTVCDELPNPGPYGIFTRLFGASRAPAPPDALPRLEEGGPRRTPRIDSESRVRFFEGAASWFRDQAQLTPAVVIIEDLQLADVASLGLLAYLTGQMKQVKLLVLLTWRSEDCPPRVLKLVGPRGIVHKTIKLSRLTELEVQRLCHGLFRGTDLAFSFGSFVFRESEGNPLFVVEILRSVNVARTGLPRATRTVPESQWQVLGSPGSLVPAGIRSAIEHRIERLPAAAERLLQVASACGRKLDLELLMKSLGFTLEEMVRQLESLVKGGFVSVSGNSYEFSHDKIRLFCYEKLSPRVRLRVHREVLGVLEALHPNRLDELAFHSESSGDARKAAAYWERIGDRATSMWAHQDAVSAYTRALEHWGAAEPRPDQIDTHFELLGKRASAWELLGEIERGEGDIQEMLETASKAKDDSRRCHALTLQGRLLLRRGYYHQASRRAREALALAQDLRDPALEARAREALALSLYRSSNDEEAHRMFLELVPLLEGLGDYESLERVWNRVASLQAAQGDSAALGSLDTAERFWAGNLNERGFRNLLRGTILASMARADEARLTLELAEQDYRRCGNLSGQALANCFLAMVHGCSGHLAQAVKHARQGLPLKAGKTDAYWRVISSTNLGHGLLLGLGNYRMAKRMIFKVLRFLPQVGGRGKGNLLDLAAVIALEEGDLELSQDLAYAALREVADYPGISKGEFLITLGRIKLVRELPSEAARILREAVAILETGFNHVELAQAFSCLAVALKASGSSDEAGNWSQRAVALLNSHGGFAYRPQEVYWNHFLVMQEHKESAALHALGRAYRVVTKRAAQLGERMRTRYLAVPLNWAIVDTWEKTLGRGKIIQPPTPDPAGHPQAKAGATNIILLIPRTGAPWGRPLRADEFVEVIWTVDAGRQDEALRELKGEVGLRRARILRLCAEGNVQGGDTREEDLARVLGVSTRTIRSDIAYLRAQGCSLQTRGANLH
ncbi:MAG: transcriptional activator domain-containing protein [Armatimonadetes bacterium CSP1-3]|nr:MAG: transcriptional activator domain-containing protein [Armatimonadetes bacterium CSP1-3]